MKKVEFFLFFLNITALYFNITFWKFQNFRPDFSCRTDTQRRTASWRFERFAALLTTRKGSWRWPRRRSTSSTSPSLATVITDCWLAKANGIKSNRDNCCNLSLYPTNIEIYGSDWKVTISDNGTLSASFQSCGFSGQFLISVHFSRDSKLSNFERDSFALRSNLDLPWKLILIKPIIKYVTGPSIRKTK